LRTRFIVIASEAKQSRVLKFTGLLRRFTYNDVNPFFFIVSLLDCFTLRVRNDGDVRLVIANGVKQSRVLKSTGLLRRFTPRNDGNRPFLDTPIYCAQNVSVLETSGR
jgi:hypothetical protein